MPQVPTTQLSSASRPGSAPEQGAGTGSASRPGSAPARGSTAGTSMSRTVGRLSFDQASKPPSLRCTTKDDFLRFLDRRFGNSVRGWRFALDPEQNMKLSYMQF